MTSSRDAPRILLAVTAGQSVQLLTGFPQFLAGNNWEVHIVSSCFPEPLERDKVTRHLIRMIREPSPVNDLVSLVKWIHLLCRVRPDIVVSGTPKAALLGMLSAFIVRVPVRVYLLRGLRLETETGLKRRVLWLLEWVTARTATRVQAVSPSLRNKALKESLTHAEKVTVVGRGSSNGVEVSPCPKPQAVSRRSVGLKTDTPVVGFVGRIAIDKGIHTLLSATRMLHDWGRRAQILVVGGEEPKGALSAAITSSGIDSDAVIWTEAVPDARPYYGVMDLLCLPTRREGFPNVVLEAAVQGVPAVVSDATGAIDSVVDSKTGWIFPVDDSRRLAELFSGLLDNPTLLKSAGTAANLHVATHFNRDAIWSLSYELYRRELAETSCRRKNFNRYRYASRKSDE